MKAHAALGCYGYSRTDVIMTDKEIVFLETNTLPGLTKASFIPQQLEAAGIEMSTFIKNQLELAKHR
jgi:D-alanine-D-alanine ligase